LDLAEQLRVLEAAQGDPAKLTLATVDLAYPELPESERAALTESLEAAAIPHWCDANILTALLDIPSHESADRLARLSRLSVVEPFRARGEDALNVHESNRIALRKRMAAENQTRFRILSGRAATHFQSDLTAAGKIEWIYHLLCGETERGATELATLDHVWSSSAHPEDRYALASALAEFERAQMVQGRARAWVLLVIAWTRASRGEEARLADMATRILDLARAAADPQAECEAQCLLGDVLSAQGELAKAQAAFGKYLTISKQLVEQDPNNPDRQRELGVAQNRVGDVLRAQGKLAGAQAAFAEDLEISRRLAERDPRNAGRQRDLAVTQSRVGDVLQAQSKLAEAEAAFGESLRISRRLAEQDLSNGDWQHDLAVAQGRLGDVLQAQGKLAEAQAAFAEGLTISRRLAEQDPTNAGWQRGLALAYWKNAHRESKRGRHGAAVPLYEEASRIFSALLKSGAGSSQWVAEKEDVDAELRSARTKAHEV
jgi:tetratricopeptide (TPR) repeat protein